MAKPEIKTVSNIGATEAEARIGLMEMLKYPEGHEAYASFDILTAELKDEQVVAVCNYSYTPKYAAQVKELIIRPAPGTAVSPLEIRLQAQENRL